MAESIAMFKMGKYAYREMNSLLTTIQARGNVR